MSALVAVLAGGRGRRMGGLGIVTALERAGGPVIAAACDMPFVSGDLLARPAAGPEAAVRLADARLVASVNTPEDLANA